MADEPTELEIKIIPDEEANLEVAQAADDKAAAKEPKEENVEKKDPAVEELTSQYKELEAREASERSRRIAAETEAARHRSEAETARKQVASSQLDTVVTALNAAKEAAEQAKRDLRAAREAGNVDDEVEAADRLAIARAEERRLDEAKDDLEARAKAPPRRQEQPKPTDVVEAFVQGRTQPTADWIRAHPEFVRTETGLKKLTAADAVAQAEGLVPDTPEYFARAEEYLGITKKEAPKPATEAAQVKPRVSAPVAPGSAVANGGSGGGQEVRLTQREYNAANDGTHVWNYDDPKGKFKKGDPIGHQEFARRKVAMQKAGLYDKSQFEA